MKINVNWKELMKHPLLIVVVSGLIITFIGSWFTYWYAKQNLIKQVELETYKDEIRQRSEFINDLSRSCYKRLYNLKVYFWSVRDAEPNDIIMKNWYVYKEKTTEWNEIISIYYINLDKYFSSNRCFITTSMEKDSKQLEGNSFRDVLENDIQEQFRDIHKDLYEIMKTIRNKGKIAGQQLSKTETKITSLDYTIYDFMEALSKARTYLDDIRDRTPVLLYRENQEPVLPKKK